MSATPASRPGSFCFVNASPMDRSRWLPGEGAPGESHPVQRTGLYAQTMAQGDVPTPRGGGLFRRRREKRQLEHLVQSSKDHGTPVPSSAHVKLVEDQAELVVEGERAAVERDAAASEQGPAAGSSRPGPLTGGFHVRPVPIEEPIGE